MVNTKEGLMWKKLKVGRFNVIYTPIDYEDEQLDNCDKDGRLLSKKQMQKAEYKFFYADDKDEKTFEGEVYKLKDGKAVSKTTLTKEVSEEDVKEIDTKFAYDLIEEHIYLCNVDDRLLEFLKEKDTAYKFPFNSGFGFKPSMAILFFDNITNSVLMITGRALKSLAIAKITQRQIEKAEVRKEIEKLKGKKEVATIKENIQIG
jgi:hypothetical protein